MNGIGKFLIEITKNITFIQKNSNCKDECD